jgi:hypothetical protein
MSPPSDASEITAPKDPAEYRPRPLMSATYWAMMALMLACVLAGIAIAVFVPTILAPKVPAPAPAAGGADHALAALPAPTAVAAISPPGPTSPSPDLDRLSARVASLEQRQAIASQAAAAALAAAAVVEASQGQGGFSDELATLRAMSPPSPELQALTTLAQSGAPTRTTLAQSYPDYAAHAAVAARAPGKGAGLGDRIVYALARVVMLRRVSDAPGDSVDALLARAERQVDDGDLDRALKTLDRLPPGARDAMASWRLRAERRAEIDRDAAALRARAVRALAPEVRPQT